MIPLARNTGHETNESFTITLSNATGGATLLIDTHTLTVSGSPAGGFAFEDADQAVNENDGTAEITVTRTGGAGGTVTVSYATSNGSATAPADYTQTSGTLTFGPGVTEQTFTVPIVQDMVPESDESFTITLSDATGGATIVSGTATVIITGNAVGAAAIPTASEWGLTVLALGLALFAARAVRHF